MIEASRLAEIKGKDPVINTFTWESLKDAPQSVEEVYNAHAVTHMSMGDTSKYVNTLRRNITNNKYSSVGAIVGPYGYGKTSTAVHVWREMQVNHGILSIPPFEWLKLSDILEAVTAWTEYKFSSGPRQYIPELKKIYEQHRDKSLEEVAAELGLDIDKAREAYAAGSINLGVTPARVIAFLMDICKLCVEKAGYAGLAVFVDELQETADKYPSIKDFQSDLFSFADKIPTQAGAMAVIFTMPDTLEATINTTRPDIVHRLRQSSLYLRVEAIYGREFPRQLWGKYAEVFDFQDGVFDPVGEDTLDAIGQIAMRRDLGAGPRTVINAMVEAVKHYELRRQAYTPFDLVNGFLENRISFEERGKFAHAVRSALENRLVSSRREYEQVIKLLAAFPLGCSDERIRQHKLAVAFDQLVESPIYGDIIYRRAEGYTLRSLLEEEVSVEPAYVRLVRDTFVRSYTPDKAHARQALLAFKTHILKAVFEPGRKDQLDKWQWKDDKILAGRTGREYVLSGSFFRKYPFRNVHITLYTSPQPSKLKWGLREGEFTFNFELNYETADDAEGYVFYVPEEQQPNEVAFQLNAMRRPRETLNIPRLPELYPTERMTPLFMLALLQFLDDIDEKIPAPEKTGELRIVKERLARYATQGLLGTDLAIDDRLVTKDVGFTMVQAIFQEMCQAMYPRYVTFITSSQWQKHEQAYVAALRDPGVTASIARGREPLETTKDRIVRLFGQRSKQTVQTMINQNFSDLAQLEWGAGRSDEATIRFSLHPLEHEILQELRNSTYSEQRQEGTIRFMPAMEIFEIAEAMGYLKEETAAAIELLREREYITFNPDRNSIEQLIRTVADLRESIIEGLATADQNIEQMELLTDFDLRRYHSMTKKVRKDVHKIKEPEDAEELNELLQSVDSGLRRLVVKAAAKIESDLRSEKSEIRPLLTAGVPDELLNPITGGQAPWGTALEESRQRLRHRYDEMIAGYKDVIRKIDHGLADLNPFGPPIDRLVRVVEMRDDVKKELDQLKNQRAALRGYQINLQEWKKILHLSNQVQQDALTAKVSFNEIQFLATTEEIWSSIAQKFKEAPLDALVDHKVYLEEITSLERSISEWQRRRRETFIEEKQSFENALRKIGDERPVLKSSFDPYIPAKDNRKNLREEATEHFLVLLGQFEQRFRQLRNEVIYASRVQQISGALTFEEVDKVLANIHELKEQFSNQIVGTGMDVDDIAQRFTTLRDSLALMTSEVQSFITMRPPQGPGESELLQTIQGNVTDSHRGADLKEVILKIVADDPDFKLDAVMKDLEGLFKKNQIIIRIQTRR